MVPFRVRLEQDWAKWQIHPAAGLHFPAAHVRATPGHSPWRPWEHGPVTAWSCRVGAEPHTTIALWSHGLNRNCPGVVQSEWGAASGSRPTLGLGWGRAVTYSLHAPVCRTGTNHRGMGAANCGSAPAPLSESQDPGVSLAPPACLTPGHTPCLHRSRPQ